jgi:mRNA interferase MazF
MNKLNFGDIVLLKFPFTDTKTFKKRPALIINDLNDDDIIVCRITSKIYETSFDVYIDNWEKSGLKLPSVIRVHKLATLEKDMVGLVIGKIDKSLKEKIRTIFTRLTD